MVALAIATLTFFSAGACAWTAAADRAISAQARIPILPSIRESLPCMVQLLRFVISVMISAKR